MDARTARVVVVRSVRVAAELMRCAFPLPHVGRAPAEETDDEVG